MHGGLERNCTGCKSCCTENNKCKADEGDCNKNEDCKGSLKCGKRNCKNKSGLQWDGDDDCCYMPGDDIFSR